jgi:hypothetical protein
MPLIKDLNLKEERDFIEIDFNDQKIKVYQYAPVEAKSAMVGLAVRGSVFDGIVDEIIMDAYFHLFLIENYTDIVFEETDFFEILKNYDMVLSSGLFQLIIDNIPSQEYNFILDSANVFKDNLNEYNRSYAAVLSTVEAIKDNLVDLAKPKTRKSSKAASASEDSN